MKSIAWVVRITGLVMSVLVCSMWISAASGEAIDTGLVKSTAWDADIVIPHTTQEVTIAVADGTPIQPSFGGNGATHFDTTAHTDTSIALVADPAYVCGQWFVGRVISHHTNDAGVLIRLSDLNSRTVINLHPHVDSDGDYRQWVDYLDESSMFYIPAGNYEVLIMAYDGGNSDSVVFDSYIGTDCPSTESDHDDDSSQAWDHHLATTNSHTSTTTTQHTTGTHTTRPSTSQSNTSNIGASGEILWSTGSNINDLDRDSSTITTSGTSLDEWLAEDSKHKNDRYQWLIAAVLWGGLIYYGSKTKKK